MDNSLNNLAQNLEGHIIGDWIIENKITNQSSTGGNFSVGYIAKNKRTDIKGFFKALDYTSALNSANSVDTLNSMTSAYIFERDLLEKCRDRHLRYIVRIIDSGRYSLSPEDNPQQKYLLPTIDYIVLEMADKSLRNVIDVSTAFDYSWILRSLHNIAVAIEEMHSIQLAHQDIKPSNVLHFESKNISKLGDVGRSSSIDTPAGHDEYPVAGDLGYSPFEQLYGYVDPDWKTRRFSCDMFMFGNLVMTCFNNISLTTSVLSRLPKSSLPRYWSDTYDNILPQIEKLFSECVDLFNTNIEDDLRSELITMIKQLCCPDIKKRGDLKNSGSQQYSLIRYISKLDLLTRKYEYQTKKVLL